MKAYTVFLAVLISLCTCACSEDKDKTITMPANKPAHQVYREWHDLCLKGESKTIEKQIKKYIQVLDKNPNDHLARVYLGSAYALRAKAGTFGPSKLLYLNKGKKQLNAAVKAAPNDPRVRMVRAIGYYKVPKRFKTRPTAVSDFEFLMKAISKKSCPLLINEKQAALYYAHLTFKEEGHKDAAKAKQLCHQLAPNSEYGKLTR